MCGHPRPRRRRKLPRDLPGLHQSRRPSPSPSTVLSQLRTRLPGYLVPERAIALPDLPLNPNGKLDVAALLQVFATAAPSPANDHTGTGRPGDVAQRVAEIYASVLGAQSVPLDTDFFALGGNSLGLGVVCTRLATAFGFPVPISEAIRCGSVRDLAAWIDHHRAHAVTTPFTASTAPPGPVPLTSLQTSFWARQYVNPDDIAAVCPTAWTIDGPLNRAALSAAVADVIRRHEALRSVYGPDVSSDEPLPVASPLPVERLGPVDHLIQELPACDSQEEGVAALRAALFQPLDPEQGDLWRGVLIPIRDTSLTLFGITIHHIAFDGYSDPVLAADLSVSYAARVTGTEPAFATEVPSLLEISERCRQLTSLADIKAQRRYWQDSLHDIPALELPRPSPSDEASTSAGPTGNLAFTLGTWESSEINRLSERHATTPFTVLLAACAAAIQRATGQSDFGLGVPVARRSDPLLAGAITCLAETVCLRMRPSDTGWDDLLSAARQTATAGLSAQDVPFGAVVQLLKPVRGSRAPLYQFHFAYQDAPSVPLQLTDCTVSPVEMLAAEIIGEVVTQVWPQADGTLRVNIAYQRARVASRFAEALRDAFLKVLREGPRASGTTVP